MDNSLRRKQDVLQLHNRIIHHLPRCHSITRRESICSYTAFHPC